MRDQWYPRKKAEYMTHARLKELGLTKNDIGERDPMFGTQIEMEEELVDDAVEAVAGLSTAAAVQAPRAAAEPALEPPSHTPAVEIEHVAVRAPWIFYEAPRPLPLDEILLTGRRSNYSPTVPSNSSPP